MNILEDHTRTIAASLGLRSTINRTTDQKEADDGKEGRVSQSVSQSVSQVAGLEVVVV